MAKRLIQPHPLAALAAVLYEARLHAAISNNRPPGPLGDSTSIARDATELHKIGRKLHGLSVRALNYGLSVRAKAAGKRAEKRAAEIATTYGAKVETGGDPRGNSVLSLLLPTKRTNGFAENGWSI